MSTDRPEPLGRYEDLMTLAPELQPGTYRQLERLYPTRLIRRGERVRPLPQAEPLALGYEQGGERLTVDDFMHRNRCAGLLLLQRGRIVLERYALGNRADTRWPSFSVAKSISSTLIGMALHEGLIGHLDEAVTRYVSALKGSAYDGVTLRQVLQMSSGVAWNENYLDPQSDRRRLLQAQVAQRPGAVLAYLAGLGRAAAPGSRFNYSTGETFLVGEILAAALGGPLADYLSARLWGPLGMESDGFWQLDAPGGREFAGSGLSATLRDFARFALFFMGGGVIDGRTLLPPGWVAQATAVQGAGHLAPGRLPGYEPRGYGYQWWTFDPLPGSARRPGPGAGLYAALGIFGQQIHVDPGRDGVLLLHSAWPTPIDAARVAETRVFMQAAMHALD